MADKSNKKFPAVTPFIFPSASNQGAKNSTTQNAHYVQAPTSSTKTNGFFSQRGLVNLAIALVSLVSLGIAMLIGASFAYSILSGNSAANAPAAAPAEQPANNNAGDGVAETVDQANALVQLLATITVIGLVFAVGWLSGTFGIRAMGNLILPFFIQFYAFLTLLGILYLHIRIIEKLFLQEYTFTSYVKYLTLFGVGILALVLLHLMLQRHNLILFGVAILFASLAHLYLIAFHYMFVPGVDYNMLLGDVGFFLFTTATSVLMIAHFGILNGVRGFIARAFSPISNLFVPQDQ